MLAQSPDPLPPFHQMSTTEESHDKKTSSAALKIDSPKRSVTESNPETGGLSPVDSDKNKESNERNLDPEPSFPHTSQISTLKKPELHIHIHPFSTNKDTSNADFNPNQSEMECDPNPGDFSVESINSEIPEEPSSFITSDSLDEESDERWKSEDITDFSEKDPSKSEAGEGNFLKAKNLECDSNKTDVIENKSSCSKPSFPSMPKGISKRKITPKQRQNRLAVEQKRQEKQKEREEISRKKKEERERIKQELLKKKEELQREKEKKIDERQKQKMEKEEQKKKEKEDREQKRKEQEEKHEQKRKERELEILKKKQQETEGKRKEQEKRDKVAAAFKNFFVKKEDKKSPKKEAQKLAFKPFELKSGMILPPSRRLLTSEDIENIDLHLQRQTKSNLYLEELKAGKPIGRSYKTQCKEEIINKEDDELMIIEPDLGESICEDRPTLQKFHAKFLSFHNNRRPPYYGTWRKKSTYVNGRKPFAQDKAIFDYELDSDDEWEEEEEQGESLEHSEDEASKENNEDDYEVDNDFFVPHGHLSEDEMDEEGNATLSPEHQKQKLKLLNDEFEINRKSNPPNRLKPRFIGCIWYNKNGDNVEPAIDRQLKQDAVLYTKPLKIDMEEKKQTNGYIPLFIQRIHGNVNSRQCIIDNFMAEMASKDLGVKIPKLKLESLFKEIAVRRRIKDKTKRRYCWSVDNTILKSYGIELKNKIQN